MSQEVDSFQKSYPTQRQRNNFITFARLIQSGFPSHLRQTCQAPQPSTSTRNQHKPRLLQAKNSQKYLAVSFIENHIMEVGVK
jgi:hypothetical protein